MSRFDREVKAPSFQFKEATRTTPEYMGQTLTIIPLSLGVGFVVLVGALLICWGLGEPARYALPISGAIMIGCVLFAFVKTFADELYMAVEKIIGQDLNHDGYIGVPAEPRQVEITISNPDNNNLQYLRLPEPLFQKLPAIARLLTMNKPFSEGAMTGSGRPLSRSEFHQLRDLFFERGLAAWRDERYPTQGVVLTARGKNVMKQLCELSTTPPRMRTPRTLNALPAGSVGEWEEVD